MYTGWVDSQTQGVHVNPQNKEKNTTMSNWGFQESKRRKKKGVEQNASYVICLKGGENKQEFCGED